MMKLQNNALAAVGVNYGADKILSIDEFKKSFLVERSVLGN